MTIDPTKEKLFYIRPGDSVRCVVEVERDECGKFKKIQCPVNPSRYWEFLIDEPLLLGKCGEPNCRRTLQFFREPIQPDTSLESEAKSSEVNERIKVKVSKIGKESMDTRRTSKPTPPPVESGSERKESSSRAPFHSANLKKSGLNNNTIEEAGIHSVVPGDISKIFNHPKVGSMLAFPYLGTDHVRYKLFSSEPILDKDGHEIKYYQPKGSSNRLYIPKGMESILSDPSVPLHITEGEKKTLKMNQEGLPCIGLGGLWSWSDGSEEKNLIQDFNLIEWKGREVYLNPDNDWLKPDRHGEKKSEASGL